MDTQAHFEAMQRELLLLRAENSKLKSKANATVVDGLSIRVSSKGAVSVYGMGRWPVTLYRTQWERLIKNIQSVQEFIELHADELASKPAKED